MFREMRRIAQKLLKEDCVNILKNEKRGVLSLIGEGGYPYGVPMNFYFDEKEEKIYFHCAKEGHKIDAIKSCDKVCFTVYDRGEKKEGDWAYYVKSVIVFGRAEFVEELKEEKLRALGNKYCPTEEDTEKEMKHINAVRIIALNIESMSGKLVHEK